MLIHSTPMEKAIKDAQSRCAAAACLLFSRTDADSRPVMPQLGVLSVRVGGIERYYLQANSIARGKTSSADECDEEPISFPSGSRESPEPASSRSARVLWTDGIVY